MEQFRDRKPANERTYSTQTEAPPRLARLVGGLLRLLRMLRHDQRGVTGMETAILMVSFVGASSALGAAYVSSNFKIFEKVQATAGTTIDAIVEEGEAYMERQGISVPDGGLAPNAESVDFAALIDSSVVSSEVAQVRQLIGVNYYCRCASIILAG